MKVRAQAQVQAGTDHDHKLDELLALKPEHSPEHELEQHSPHSSPWQTIACIRQPSMGPTFGIKGGAAGGGYSQVRANPVAALCQRGIVH